MHHGWEQKDFFLLIHDQYIHSDIRKVLSRPTTFFLFLKFIIKSSLGEELANAAILSSSRIIPKRLTQIGYNFVFHIWNQYN
jgi:NAD dependent epimerase/dehydratase family enzyme